MYNCGFMGLTLTQVNMGQAYCSLTQENAHVYLISDGLQICHKARARRQECDQVYFPMEVWSWQDKHKLNQHPTRSQYHSFMASKEPGICYTSSKIP